MVARHFYVIVRGDAERRVERAKQLAYEIDPFAWFYAYGIASTPLTLRPASRFGQ